MLRNSQGYSWHGTLMFSATSNEEVVWTYLRDVNDADIQKNYLREQSHRRQLLVS